jgi:lipid A 4'-phosphatase
VSRRVFIALILVTIAAIFVFAAWPDLDLAVASAFFRPPNIFVARGAWGNVAREIFSAAPFVVLAAYVLAYAARHFDLTFARGWRFAPSGRAVAFLVTTMALGPGLLVNLTFKDHTHRPRPSHVERFGGTLPFRPFYATDGACPKNCAFPSGEASASFWLVAPALLAPPQAKPLAVAGALAFGAATGLLRMAFGGHFLSDVVFAALLTLLLVGAAWRLMFGWEKRMANSELGVARSE